jgi:hypothetical protein
LNTNLTQGDRLIVAEGSELVLDEMQMKNMMFVGSHMIYTAAK